MNLLGNEPKQEVKGKKLVLTLLIISIILLIFILIMMFALGGRKTKTLGLNIDGADIQITENMLISKENGTYISLEKLSPLLGYNYLRGGYLEYVEDNTKCYLQNETQIIGFEANTNEIYKTTQNSTTDYEYYKLNNNIIQENGMLYIELEDLNVACNAYYTFSETAYKILLYTPKNLTTAYATQFSNEGFTIDSNYNNQKAMAYNMVVVSNENGRMGVVDWDANPIISPKYTTMEFDEFSQSFIVSDENKYGVIPKQGNNVIVELKYEDIKVINYSPLLYQVKLNNKFGILNKSGQTIVNAEYDKIGFTSSSNTIESTLIIKDINDQDGIVVCKNGKYGLISLSTGRAIFDCNVDKIYSKTDNNGKKSYYIELQNTEIDLATYIDYINTTTVVTN